MIVYGKAYCRPCEALKHWLKTKNIEYEYIDITQDNEAFELIRGHGFMAVPVVKIGDRYLAASNISVVAEALGL